MKRLLQFFFCIRVVLSVDTCDFLLSYVFIITQLKYYFFIDLFYFFYYYFFFFFI